MEDHHLYLYRIISAFQKCHRGSSLIFGQTRYQPISRPLVLSQLKCLILEINQLERFQNSIVLNL